MIYVTFVIGFMLGIFLNELTHHEPHDDENLY